NERCTRAFRRLAQTPPVEKRRGEVVKLLESLWDRQALGLTEPMTELQIQVLARWGGKDSVPTLVRWTENREWLRGQVCDVLVEMKDETAAAAVARWVHPFDHARRAALALMAMGPVAEKSVIPLLTNTDFRIAGDACWVLAEIGGHDSVTPLAKAA